MSSMISTVFPTPAPPKSPIFPPFVYGAIKSTTLIPVVKISYPYPCSTKVGASRWIGNFNFVVIGPYSSMGCPITFIILPRHSGPTGMVIGDPVSMTTCPRTSPSVESIAIVRTRESPKWWDTSRINVFSVPCTSNAFKIAGSYSENCTSTTAPMICFTQKQINIG